MHIYHPQNIAMGNIGCFVAENDELLPILQHQLLWQSFSSSLSYTKYSLHLLLTLKVLVTTIDAQWEGMGDVGSSRYEPALLPLCPTIRVLSYSN